MAFPAKQSRTDYALPAQKAAAAIKRGDAKPQVVTRKQRAAIEAMVHDGLRRDEAAKAAGMNAEVLRRALTKPHVLAYLNEQMEVLRTSARPRALRKMADLLDAKTERIQFEAAKYLDGMDRPGHAVGAVNVQVNTQVNVETPGYIIDLTDHPTQGRRGQQIDHLAQHERNGLDDNTDVPDDD